jgi:pilus assembly protein Flp/PilA
MEMLMHRRFCLRGLIAHSIVKSRAIFRLIEDRRGVTAIEYALIAAMIIVVAIAIIGSVGTNPSTTFSSVAAAL